MKEKIYMIPINDAFRAECECPLCILEKDLEDRYINDILNHSTLDVHMREETNRQGFCRMHYEMMYASYHHRLQLGLLLDTFLQSQNRNLVKVSGIKPAGQKDRSLFKRYSDVREKAARMVEYMKMQESQCNLCSRIENYMIQYCKVILLMWKTEPEFRELVRNKKGMCQKHFRQMMETVLKERMSEETDGLVRLLIGMQEEHLCRIQEEVHWFTEMFSYHNKDAPWKNSKDALIRGIQKVVGQCRLQ